MSDTRHNSEDPGLIALVQAIQEHVQQVQRRMMAKRQQYGKAAKKTQREQTPSANRTDGEWTQGHTRQRKRP